MRKLRINELIWKIDSLHRADCLLARGLMTSFFKSASSVGRAAIAWAVKVTTY